MGVPNSSMVYFMENPNLKWMMTGGTPMTLETPRCSSIVTPKDRWNSLCHHYFHILRWNPSHGIHGKWDDPPFSHRPDGFEPRFRAIRMSQCIFTIVPPSKPTPDSPFNPAIQTWQWNMSHDDVDDVDVFIKKPPDFHGFPCISMDFRGFPMFDTGVDAILNDQKAGPPPVQAPCSQSQSLRTQGIRH